MKKSGIRQPCIDLGWTPEEDPNGEYLLRLTDLQDAEFKILREKRTKNREEVRKTIDYWLETVALT